MSWERAATGTLVVLTGVSGVGKTSIALALEQRHPEIDVFRFDTIGVPTAAAMAAYGTGHQPGGAWQRAATLQWMQRLAPLVTSGRRVLLEGQMRPAFIHEAFAASHVSGRIVLVECAATIRNQRLTEERLQPDLANDAMEDWSRHLHQEAAWFECDILDTAALTVQQGVLRIVSYFCA